MDQTIDISELKRRMEGAVHILKQEFIGLRTGRASAGLLEPLRVDAYGQHLPLVQVSTISVPDARTLAVHVWDQTMVPFVEKSIRDSHLGLNPMTEGQVLRIRIPELNEERRKDMVKVAHKYAEEARISIRHVRRDGMGQLKKMLKDKFLSEDQEKRDEQEIQKMTDRMIAEVEQLLTHKEKEILQV